MGVEATIVNFAPCLVSNAYTGVAINQNLFSISPTVLKFDPTGVNVSSTNPIMISLFVVSTPRARSEYFTLAPRALNDKRSAEGCRLFMARHDLLLQLVKNVLLQSPHVIPHALKGTKGLECWTALAFMTRHHLSANESWLSCMLFL